MQNFLVYNVCTGVAWLLSIRAVKCLVKSFNECNSFFILVIFFVYI